MRWPTCTSRPPWRVPTAALRQPGRSPRPTRLNCSEAAATARVSATLAFQHCARNYIQVHGGMGFTWAFDCHLYYRRSNLLALNLGSQSQWEDHLIARLRAKNAA